MVYPSEEGRIRGREKYLLPVMGGDWVEKTVLPIRGGIRIGDGKMGWEVSL